MKVLIENLDQVVKLRAWIDTLSFMGKAPRGMKDQKESLIQLKAFFMVKDEYGLPYDDNAFNIINMYVGKLDEDMINLKYGVNQKPNIILKPIAIYEKADSKSYSRFTEEVNNIELFLNTLRGIHTKALVGLKIKFVSSAEIKSTAKYVSKSDTILINLNKVRAVGIEYGSLCYILLHELGHRYLTLYKQDWDIDSYEWSTTKYSQVDCFNGEERFAELYAISNWITKYPEYETKIIKFLHVVSK